VDIDCRGDRLGLASNRLSRRRRNEFFRRRNTLAESNHVSSIEIGPVSYSIKEHNVFGMRLVARFGGNVLSPDVRQLIAQCPRRDEQGRARGIYYADLRHPWERHYDHSFFLP
jgi:hypothetical protein